MFFANSVDPKKTAHERSRQDLRCLLFCFYFLAETPILNNCSDHIKTWNSPLQKLIDERVKEKSQTAIGLSHLQKFVNVYTEGHTQNDSMYPKQFQNHFTKRQEE